MENHEKSMKIKASENYMFLYIFILQYLSRMRTRSGEAQKSVKKRHRYDIEGFRI